MAKTCEIKRDKKNENIFSVKMNVSEGKIIAITRALKLYNSPVGNDVLNMIIYAVQDDSTLKDSVNESITLDTQVGSKHSTMTSMLHGYQTQI